MHEHYPSADGFVHLRMFTNKVLEMIMARWLTHVGHGSSSGESGTSILPQRLRSEDVTVGSSNDIVALNSVCSACEKESDGELGRPKKTGVIPTVGLVTSSDWSFGAIWLMVPCLNCNLISFPTKNALIYWIWGAIGIFDPFFLTMTMIDGSRWIKHCFPVSDQHLSARLYRVPS